MKYRTPMRKEDERALVPDLVADAIDYADEEQHNGAGYTLMIGFANGKELEFDVHRDGGRHVLKWKHGADVAILNPDQINHVRIAWD